MAFSKVTLNGETLMDVTDDTVAANNMLYGTRGTAANGTTVTGAVVTTPVDSTLDTTSHNAIENAAVASALALKADSSSIPSATSDLTNDSGFISTETDPVFGASAAATITSSDITNWNNKASSDTKVTQTNITTSGAYPILLGYQVGEVTTTEVVYKSYPNLTYNPNSKALSTGGTVNGYTLAAASAKGVDTSISTASSSANLPTSAAVASFVEGKGYLTSYTETDPTVPEWAKQSTKPTYTFSELTSHPTSISGYGITDAYTKTEVDSAVAACSPVTAYYVTLDAANWSNTTPSSYVYSNSSLKCGANGDVPPIITCISNESEYSMITSAISTASNGIVFYALSAPTAAIGLIITDFH